LEIYVRTIYGAAFEHNCMAWKTEKPKIENKTTAKQQVQKLAINICGYVKRGESLRFGLALDAKIL